MLNLLKWHVVICRKNHKIQWVLPVDLYDSDVLTNHNLPLLQIMDLGMGNGVSVGSLSML